jgi:hypothetical protein
MAQEAALPHPASHEEDQLGMLPKSSETRGPDAGVFVAVFVAECVGVFVRVFVGVLVRVFVGVLVRVFVAVWVGVFVDVGGAPCPSMRKVSQPTWEVPFPEEPSL